MKLAATTTILVPTDFSPASDLAVEVGMELAELLRASIELLHVTADPLVVAFPPGSVAPVPIDPSAALAAESGPLDAAAARIRRRGINCSVAQTMGRTHAEIVEHARQTGVGLIILGSHSHHGLTGTFLGHVTEKVVRHAPCPVLVVPLAPLAEEEKVSSPEPLALADASVLVT